MRNPATETGLKRRLVDVRTWDAAVLVFNAVLVAIFFVAFWSLWGRSSDHLSRAGGLPPVTREGLKALADSGAKVLPRIEDWSLAWVYAVFSVGALILMLSGLRYMVVATKRFF